MKQVEIFSRSDVIKLQGQINDFLKQRQKNNEEVLDIRFTSTESTEKEPMYAALIIYNKNEEELSSMAPEVKIENG